MHFIIQGIPTHQISSNIEDLKIEYQNFQIKITLQLFRTKHIYCISISLHILDTKQNYQSFPYIHSNFA